MRLDILRANCPKCAHQLWARRRGEWTLANKIIKMDEQGQVSAKCPRCGEVVPVPFLAAKPAPKRQRRLVVRAKG